MSDEFRCVRCGACCRWEGPVRVTEAEVDAIAAFLGIPVKDFIRDHTVLTQDRRSLSLRENPDGSCCYYDPDARLCRIQEVKPKQCRDFPAGWNFPGWEKLCAGAQTEPAEYPAYRGPVKLMAALVLIFGSVPFLTAFKVIPLFRGTLSPEGFCRWWSAWLENGTGFAMIGFPLLTAGLILTLVLAKLTRKTRFRLWFAAAGATALSAVFLYRNFIAAVQFEALLLALGGAALWLGRKTGGAKNGSPALDK
ncbi:MAG: YkgJ family cysteine cluster protein [Lentisphaeria bacterium]|nr:YkgJ family cysteine cluster protein [Lentisphaeria bacterium]